MAAPVPSLFQIRLRAPHTATDAQWAETFHALSDNRDACDEVWFSTGIAFPPMAWHREHTERLAAERAFLERYRDANLDTVPAGLDVPPDLPLDGVHAYALAGIPVVPGTGRTFGTPSERSPSRFPSCATAPTPASPFRLFSPGAPAGWSSEAPRSRTVAFLADTAYDSASATLFHEIIRE